MVNCRGNGFQNLQAVEGPVIEGITWNADAAALKDALLTVERQVIGVFSDDEVGD